MITVDRGATVHDHHEFWNWRTRVLQAAEAEAEMILVAGPTGADRARNEAGDDGVLDYAERSFRPVSTNLNMVANMTNDGSCTRPLMVTAQQPPPARARP